MSGLAFAQAPPPRHPLRFLLTALAWGGGAGLWLAWQGPDLLASRWSPATIAWVHLFTLGMLGNALLGSVIQFLPVALGSPLPWARHAPSLHGLLNAGLIVFFLALRWPGQGLLALAACLLAPALFAFGCAGLIAVARGHGARVPRLGVGLALACLLATVALGVLLLAVLAGLLSWPLDRIANLHAAIGLCGWMLALLGAVGSITVPMFQGTPRVPPRGLLIWLGLLAASLSAAGVAISLGHAGTVRLLWLPAAIFCLTVLYLQARVTHPRNPALRGYWRAGCIALAVACLIAAAPWPQQALLPTRMAAALAIMIGLPLLVIGMMLEILGFLAWIELRRLHPRGVRVPGVDRLLGETSKQRLLYLHLLAAVLLLLALWQPLLARPAGLAMGGAYAASLWLAWRAWTQALRFRPAPPAAA